MAAFHKQHPPVGSRPGTLAIDPAASKPRIRVFDYDESRVDETEVSDLQGLAAYASTSSTTWIDVQGLGDEQILRDIGEIFSFHPLLLEDVVNVPQRPKVEPYPEQLLLVGRMVRMTGQEVDREQISICLGEHYVVTFQERYGDVFDPVRARIRAGKGPIRRSGPDYLAYALLDTSIDGFYPVVEFIGDQLEELEGDVLVRPQPDNLKRIFLLKRELLDLRRAIWPQRDVYSSIIREELEYVRPDTRLYFRDVYDHTIQIMDVLESYRELAGGLLDVYMSSVGNKMNEVMKVLTIMASVFIPLTFIAGIYGMNFDFMPELHVAWAYPVALVVMAGVAIGMLAFFWWKGWIGGGSSRSHS